MRRRGRDALLVAKGADPKIERCGRSEGQPPHRKRRARRETYRVYAAGAVGGPGGVTALRLAASATARIQRIAAPAGMLAAVDIWSMSSTWT
jgi:hypothetical protein